MKHAPVETVSEVFLTESVEDAGQLYTNVTSSNNSNALGLVLQIKETIAINSQLCSGNLGDCRATT